MTNTQTKPETTAPQSEATKAPALIAYHVAERAGKHYWTRIGAAWDHEDAKGLTVQLDLIPAEGGKIVLREAGQENGQEQG